MHIKSIQQFNDHFQVNCYIPTEEKRLAHFEGGSEVASRVKK